MSAAWLGSMRTRLILLVVLSVLPALGIMGYSAHEQRRFDAARAQANAQRQAALAAADFDRAVVATQHVLLLLSQMPQLRGDPAACDAFLAGLIAGYPMYGNFNVIPKDGTVRCASLPSPQRVYLGDRSYFRRALEARTFAAGDYTIGRTTGRPSIVFAMPLTDSSGAVDAVLSVGLDISWLNRHLSGMSWPKGTTLTLLDQGGTIIGSYPDAGMIGTSVKGRSEIASLLDGESGTGRAQGSDGPMLIGYAASDAGTQAARMHVMIGIPERIAFAAADRQLAQGMAALLAAAALAIAAAWLIGDRLIVRPVRTLVDTTKAVADGDLSARTRLPHDEGELGQLARCFDGMAADLQQAYLGTVEVLADAVEARDPYTGGHVKRVCDYSLAIGRELGWTERQLLQLQMAAALHDVGKIGVPDAVLRKEGPLDADELPVMRSHTQIGAELLEGVPFLYPAMQCAMGHQEFFDGRGYPHGLAGENIPPEARVVAIADTFDALTTDRPYRNGTSAEAAIAEIRRCAGTQFDPDMVEAFVRTMARRRRAGAPG